MSKHSIRQRVLDPVTGLKVTKIETVTGELGSGVKDKNGVEIYEGDIILLDGEKFVATIDEGSFIIKNNNGEFYYLESLLGEIVGHVEG